MKRITLFSALTESNSEVILDQIFPAEISNRILAYMPSSGPKGAKDYIRQWEVIAQKYGARFTVIDNTLHSSEEQKKLLDSNILVISGGNTFGLLHNVRMSGLDESIRTFLKKPNFVLAGFSAGALVLTPTIKICNLPNLDENLAQLKDLTGLNIVDFEIFPHYEKRLHERMLSDYRETTGNHVREITDEGYISINL